MTAEGAGSAARIAAIIVAYDSADVIEACLASVIHQDGGAPQIVVVDNASPDNSAHLVRQFAEQRGLSLAEGPPGQVRQDAAVTIIRAAANQGFAAGVNLGLNHAMARPELDLFWLLNPDCSASAGAAYAFCARAARTKRLGLMGGRVVYHGTDIVQSDGGHLRPWTAVAENLNQGHNARVPFEPRKSLDFASGANLVATRRFVEQVGPMPERYFLYYEEIDWALRRGSLDLVMVPDATVFHHGGTAAGSGTHGRAPSAFANYFNYRNRLRLAARHVPHALPGAYLYSMAKIAQMAWDGQRRAAWGALRGLHQLPPDQAMRARLGQHSLDSVYGRRRRRALTRS